MRDHSRARRKLGFRATLPLLCHRRRTRSFDGLVIFDDIDGQRLNAPISRDDDFDDVIKLAHSPAILPVVINQVVTECISLGRNQPVRSTAHGSIIPGTCRQGNQNGTNERAGVYRPV